MLGIDFLKQNSPLNFAGMEFMDYVSSELYPNLVKFFGEYIVKDDETNLDIINISKESVDKFREIIFPATGMNILLTSSSTIGNMGVDVAFMNPQNLLNISGLDSFVDKSETTIARAMKIMKTDILKGWVDTSTGRIGGDFSKIEFVISVNPWIAEWNKTKVLARLKISKAEALAIATCHELGHIFTGLLYITRSCFDAVLPAVAIRQISDKSIYGKERVTIINDTLKELDIPGLAKVDDVATMEADQLAVYFSKAINNRDMHRTLSIGTAERGSEVLADLYATRMGCPKAMVAGIAALKSDFPVAGMSVAGALSIYFGALGAGVLSGMAGTIFAGMVLLRASMFLSPGNTYDTPYRRMKNILRDTIVNLNDNKNMDRREKVKLLATAKDMEKTIESFKPLFEGTGVQRLIGYISSGTDFRATDFEHYTDELLAHSLSLYKDTF